MYRWRWILQGWRNCQVAALATRWTFTSAASLSGVELKPMTASTSCLADSLVSLGRMSSTSFGQRALGLSDSSRERIVESSKLFRATSASERPKLLMIDS